VLRRRALVVWGGWDGHQPREVARLFERILGEEGFDVRLSDSLDSFNDPGSIGAYSLIVPHWTMGRLTHEQQNAVCSAVAGGVGMAGCHGGMCDAFRESTEWQFMTGGQWVAHPGDDGTRHIIRIGPTKHQITEGLGDFEVSTEMYYMHVDPAVKVLATCRLPVADGPHVGNGPVDMPVAWTKVYGRGRVFYCSLGHRAAVLEIPPVKTMMRRGFAWAARQSR